MGKVWETQQLVDSLVFAKIGVRVNCGELSNWFSAAPLKFNPKQSEAAFWAVSSNFGKYRPEVADDVISGLAIDYVSFDVRAKYGDSIRPRNIRTADFVTNERT